MHCVVEAFYAPGKDGVTILTKANKQRYTDRPLF